MFRARYFVIFTSFMTGLACLLAAKYSKKSMVDASFQQALEFSLQISANRKSEKRTVHGHGQVTGQQVLDTLLAVKKKTEKSKLFTPGVLKQGFQLVRLQGNDSRVTGYYTPSIRGARKPGKVFDTPVYAKPADLVTLRLAEFNLPARTIRGRVSDGRFRPYYRRDQIETAPGFQDRAPVLFYTTFLDAYFMQVEGAAMVDFKDKSRQLFTYAADNGHGYISLGEIFGPWASQQALSQMLGHRRNQVRQRLMKNPRFVFFRSSSQGHIPGAFGTPLVARRSVAADTAAVIPGSLLYLKSRRLNRLVFVHDRGAAIKGAGRIDYYTGMQKNSEAEAKKINEAAEVYLVVLPGTALN